MSQRQERKVYSDGDRAVRRTERQHECRGDGTDNSGTGDREGGARRRSHLRACRQIPPSLVRPQLFDASRSPPRPEPLLPSPVLIDAPLRAFDQ
jgi:hypothetical protein